MSKPATAARVTLVGYFYTAQDARRAHNHLRCEFETTAMGPHLTPTGAGPAWYVSVVDPGEGPHLHALEAAEDFAEAVSRFNGTLDPAPALTVVATRGGGTYLLDVGGGMGQIADTHRGVLFGLRRLGAIVARGYWEPCSEVSAAAVLAACRPEGAPPYRR